VLLDVRAVSVNFVDLVMMSGSYQFKPPLPFIPGKLPVGVVAAVGDGVTKFRPGDHALLMAEAAGFAEFAVMPEGQCIKLPASLSFEEAASMALVYDTAYFALKGRGGSSPARPCSCSARPAESASPQFNWPRHSAARCLPLSPARTRRTSCARPAPTRSSICPFRICMRICERKCSR
jgi:hypothetical protein